MLTRREFLRGVFYTGVSATALALSETAARPVNAATKVLKELAGGGPDGEGGMEFSSECQHYHLSCESSAAARVFQKLAGGTVTDWEDILITNLRQTSSPSTGFWGAIHGDYTIYAIPEGDGQFISKPISSHVGPGYGIHWGPMAEAMNRVAGEYQTAKATNLNYQSLAEQITAGNPVLIWVINSAERASRTLGDGTTVWYCEHCVVAAGARQAADGSYYFRINDPYWGTDGWRSQNSGSMLSWAQNFGGGSVIIEPKQPIESQGAIPMVINSPEQNNRKISPRHKFLAN